MIRIYHTTFFILLLALTLSGCASSGKRKTLQTQVNDLETRLRQQQQIIIEQEQMIGSRDQELRRLQVLNQDKDKLLREKEEKIIQLRRRLEGFGVFE